MNIFYYELTILDSDDAETNEYGGVLSAKDYTDAMAQLEKYYSDEISSILSIDTLEEWDGNILMFPKEVAKYLKEQGI